MVDFQRYCALCRSPLSAPGDPYGEEVVHLDFTGGHVDEDDEDHGGYGYNPALVDDEGINTGA